MRSIPDKPVIEGGQTSTGSVIAWFKRHFAPNTTFDALNDEAAKIEPGCEGLLVLDHFQGNRTPYTDALSRGAITGLTLKHTPAHVYRAIIEGICLGTKLIVENFGAAFSPKRIVVAGGATHSPLWLQIHADTIGAPLELTEVPTRRRSAARSSPRMAPGASAASRKAPRRWCALRAPSSRTPPTPSAMTLSIRNIASFMPR